MMATAKNDSDEMKPKIPALIKNSGTNFIARLAKKNILKAWQIAADKRRRLLALNILPITPIRTPIGIMTTIG